VIARGKVVAKFVASENKEDCERILKPKPKIAEFKGIFVDPLDTRDGRREECYDEEQNVHKEEPAASRGYSFREGSLVCVWLFVTHSFFYRRLEQDSEKQLNVEIGNKENQE
jgi:hypothetical protein